MIQDVLREQKSLRADRVVEGISSLLLSLKWKPAIRFQRRYAWFYHNLEIFLYDTSCPLDVAPFMHSSSSRCRHVAEEIHRLAYIQVLRTIVSLPTNLCFLFSCKSQEPGLFDFRQKVGDYQLIVLDRMEDPVTPLLSQWTYQVSFVFYMFLKSSMNMTLFCSIKAMVHEILGIKNNKVQLRHSLNDEKVWACISPASARVHASSILKHLEVQSWSLE